MLHLKPWKILTTDPHMQRALDRQCNGDHAHAPVSGPSTLGTGFYPRPMCRRIASVILQRPEWAGVVEELIRDETLPCGT